MKAKRISFKHLTFCFSFGVDFIFLLYFLFLVLWTILKEGDEKEFFFWTFAPCKDTIAWQWSVAVKGRTQGEYTALSVPSCYIGWASCLISVSWLLYLCNRDSVPFGCCADKLNSFLQNRKVSRAWNVYSCYPKYIPQFHHASLRLWDPSFLVHWQTLCNSEWREADLLAYSFSSKLILLHHIHLGPLLSRVDTA